MQAIDMAQQTDTAAALDAVRQRLGYPATLALDADTNIPALLQRAVDEFADKPAYTCLGKTIRFADLDRLSKTFATYLQQCDGLAAGDRIAIQLPNILQYPVVVFGALRAGLVVVNTNPLYTPHEMQHQFQDAGVKAIVILANVASKLEAVLADTPIRHVIVTELADLHDWPQRIVINTAAKYLKKMVPPFHLPRAISLRSALAQGAGSELKLVSQKRDDIAVLQYTGGTTGVAKGAMLTHANLLANVRQCEVFMQKAGVNRGGEIVVAPLPLYHIYAFMLHILLMVDSGNHSLLIPDPRNFSAVTKVLSKYPFSVFIGINTLFVALANYGAFCKLDFSALKLTFSGGMALTESAAKRWQQTTGCAVIEGYGLTESSPVLTVNPPGHARIGSIGIPLANTDIGIVDDNGVMQPIGVAGELCARGPQVMKGYWQREQATADTIVNGWLHTGDIAIVDPDGFVRIVDRKKDMIIVSGFNVYPNEIENVMSAHPDIIECAAIGVPDELTGEAVKLFVVSRNPELDVEQVRAFARKELTAYKVPKQVEFRETLPKSNVGKILRRELRG